MKELQDLIRQTYGTTSNFARMNKVTRQTATTYLKETDKIPFKVIRNICRHSKINISKFIKTGVCDEIE